MASESKRETVSSKPSIPFYAQFEAKIRKLLESLGFKDIRGGVGFNVGGIQIDALGGHEDVLIVVECTASKGKVKVDLREKMKAFRGVMAQIESGAQKIPLLSKYKRFVYIVATNGEVKEADRNFAKEPPLVHLWDSQVTAYYEDLSSAIGKFARFNLLGELHIDPMTKSDFQLPAFRIKTKDGELYEFFADAEHLLSVSYVARREIGHDDYYQRFVKKARLKTIEEYVRKDNKIFPNSIVVAFVEKPDFTSWKELLEESKQPDLWPEWIEFGLLQFPKSYRACWVVDGQHRLYGLANVPQTRVAVTAFGALRTEEQARYFLDINGEQRRVPADLIWDLSGDLTPNEDSGIISRIAKDLNSSGPLQSKIYIPALGGTKNSRPIKIASVCEAIRRVGLVRSNTVSMRGAEKNPLRGGSPDERVKLVSRGLSTFFQEVALTFKESDGADYIGEFFFDNTGLGLSILLFERVLTAAGKAPTPRDLAPYLKALREYMKSVYQKDQDLRDLRKACGGEGGRGLVADEFSIEINSRIHAPIKPLILGQSAEVAAQEYTDLEKNLRYLVRTVLDKNKKGANWLKEFLNPDVVKRLEEARGEDKQTPLWQFLTIGQCKNLILAEAPWRLFKEIFIGGQAGFANRELFEGSFQLLIDKGRNPQIHGRVANTKPGDAEILRGAKSKIQACIKLALRQSSSPEPRVSDESGGSPKKEAT